MIKNAFLSFLMLFLATLAFSQSSLKYELSLTKRANGKQEEINYTIRCSEHGGILIIKEKIFPSKGSIEDSLYVAKVLQKPSDEQRILLREFVELKTSYISDSLVITDQNVLEDIGFLVSQWAVLVEQSTLKNPNRMALDGTSFSFSLIKENLEPYSFSIHSPDDQTHPEIIRLLRSIQLLSE
jgi:hypothetical protein